MLDRVHNLSRELKRARQHEQRTRSPLLRVPLRPSTAFSTRGAMRKQAPTSAERSARSTTTPDPANEEHCSGHLLDWWLAGKEGTPVLLCELQNAGQLGEKARPEVIPAALPVSVRSTGDLNAEVCQQKLNNLLLTQSSALAGSNQNLSNRDHGVAPHIHIATTPCSYHRGTVSATPCSR